MDLHAAFQKANDHGYRIPGVETHFGGVNAEYSVWTMPENQSSFMIPVQETFLAPDFWQALGRALGWDEPCHVCIACSQGEKWNICHGYYWMYQWHCFIQHIAEGKTAESFFEPFSTPHTSHDAQDTVPPPPHRSSD